MERATNADRAGYVLRTSPSALRAKGSDDLNLSARRTMKTQRVGSGRLGDRPEAPTDPDVLEFPDHQREFVQFWPSEGRLAVKNTLSALGFLPEFPTQLNREF